MRPNSHVTGDAGQLAVAGIIVDWGWTADLIRSDYGEDLDCHVFVENKRTPLHFRCQVKSSEDADQKVRRLRSGDFSVRIASSTSRNWLLSYYPVLLIVFDRRTKTAYWVNATEQVRAKVESLSRSEVIFHIDHRSNLVRDETQVMPALTTFYSRLYKIHSESVERMVFPVLMPGYRVIPATETHKLLRGGPLHGDIPEHISIHRDSLPAWTTTLRTLDSQFLSGMSFRTPSADLANFSSMLTTELSGVASPSTRGEWISFVCSPIRFSIQRNEDQNDALGRDLTGWSSYAKIGDDVVSDHMYAFEPPAGFIRQIGRRARSWPGYYFVSQEYDVAIQLLAGVATTPADQLFRSMLRDHMLGQFLPWECPVAELQKLQQILWNAELIFAPLEEPESKAGQTGLVAGAISTPMFSPTLGMIPQARNWAELEQGSVRSRLEQTGLRTGLPGREGSPELREELLSRVRHLVEDVPNRWLVDGTIPEPGLPIDLANRRVVVQRFRADSALDPEQATKRLQELATELADYVLNGESITMDAYIIEEYNRIAELTIEWSPQLGESSAQAVELALPAIVKIYDQILPKRVVTENLGSTLHALKYAGELYFEGDQLY